MSVVYITVQQALKKYSLNPSKVQLAIRNNAQNGLYKAIFRKRSRLFFREDYFEKWLEQNDVTSPSRRLGRNVTRTNH